MLARLVPDPTDSRTRGLLAAYLVGLLAAAIAFGVLFVEKIGLVDLPGSVHDTLVLIFYGVFSLSTLLIIAVITSASLSNKHSAPADPSATLDERSSSEQGSSSE